MSCFNITWASQVPCITRENCESHWQKAKNPPENKKYTSSPWKISPTSKIESPGHKVEVFGHPSTAPTEGVASTSVQLPAQLHNSWLFLTEKKRTKWYKLLPSFLPFFHLDHNLGFFLKPDFCCPSYFFSKITGLCRISASLGLFLWLCWLSTVKPSPQPLNDRFSVATSTPGHPGENQQHHSGFFGGIETIHPIICWTLSFFVSSPEYTNIVTKQRQYPQCSAAGLIHTSGHHHLSETTFHQFTATALDQNHSNCKAPHHHRSGAASVTWGMKWRKHQEIHVQASIKMVVRSHNMGSRSHRSKSTTDRNWPVEMAKKYMGNWGDPYKVELFCPHLWLVTLVLILQQLFRVKRNPFKIPANRHLPTLLVHPEPWASCKFACTAVEKLNVVKEQVETNVAFLEVVFVTLSLSITFVTFLTSYDS